MIELNKKAGIYAEENVINVLKEAIAKAYADGYRDGYKDCKKEMPLDIHDSKSESVDFDSPNETKESREKSLSTDVFIFSCYEKKEDDSSKHFVELLLKEYKSPLYVAAVGTPQYKLRLDLKQHYNNNLGVLTNGRYDRQKAMELLRQEFPMHVKISLKCKLYDFPISELTGGRNNKLKYYHGSIISVYNHADFSHDREIAKRNCQQYICELIRKGVLEPYA